MDNFGLRCLLSQKYAIRIIWIGFLVIKLKCSHKYNSSPIFFDTHFRKDLLIDIVGQIEWSEVPGLVFHELIQTFIV